MTFEEWCHSTGMDDARVVPGDMVSMETLKECWDYQEQKLASANKVIEDYAGPDCDETGRSIIKDGKQAREWLKDNE